MTVRTNTLNVWVKGNVSEVAYTLGEHKITAGQEWKAFHSSASDENLLTITVEAGRHNDSEVAKWFKKGVDVSTGGSMIGCDTVDLEPSQLNFAFNGKLSFKFNGLDAFIDGVYFGQGHNIKQRNNWWAGYNTTGDTKVIPNHQITWVIAPVSGMENEFTLTITITELS